MRPHAKKLELVHRIDKETSGCLIIAKKHNILVKFHNMIKTVKSNVVSKFFRRITNKLRVSLVPQMDVMKYFSQASEFKYGHPEGHYIRAVVTKSHQ